MAYGVLQTFVANNGRLRDTLKDGCD
jgi:hypothetical protein